MNQPTSIYLDLVRFLAAVTVFLSHTADRRYSGGVLWQISPMGPEAVMVFFVLSGFVITYAVEERERSARTFVINRMARIYSVTIPALALTFLLDPIGRAVTPQLYLGWPDYAPNQVTWQVLNSILFTNQIWFNHVQPGTIGPYWSMGFEVSYYIAFGVAIFAPRRWAIAGALAVMFVAGPNIAVLFPIWLLGVACYRLCAKYPLGARAGLLLWILSSIAIAIVEFLPADRQLPIGTISFSPERLRSIVHFYVVAFLFAAHVVGFRGASPALAAPLKLFMRPIRWVGQRTFALYLFHEPIMQFVVAVAPWPAKSWLTRGLVFFGVPLVVFGLAEVTERRKDAWRSLFDTLLVSKLPIKSSD